MSRPLRIEYPDAWYHVMNRGRRGEEIFGRKENYRQFREMVKSRKLKAQGPIGYYQNLVHQKRFFPTLGGEYGKKMFRGHGLNFFNYPSDGFNRLGPTQA
jgi:hypothetical protein